MVYDIPYIKTATFKIMISTLVIAAAGRGTRMQHLAKNRPKHLIPVCGKPFLHYVLDFAQESGFEHIVIVVGHMKEQMIEFLEKQPQNITIVDQNEQVGDKYGSAAVIEAVEEAVGNNPFVFINGDNLYTEDVFKVVKKDDGKSRVVGMHHPNPSQYGVIDANSDMSLKEIAEKPDEPKCDVINLGVYSFQPEVFEVVKLVQPSARNEYEITDAVNILATRATVQVERVSAGDWLDFGKPEDLVAVEKYLQEHGLCDSVVGHKD